MITKKFQLKNGMNVLMVESHKSPVVSVQMWVRTGSADEKKGEEGISHFIEHLVFKGTRKFKVGEIASVIEGSGGELNAYTSFDQTVFYVTISKHFIDTGLLAIAEMMGFPKFDPKEIDNEREVVIEEIKRGQDSLGRRASQLMFSTAFKKHPYGIPVIGYDKNIRKVTPATLKNYYKVRYSPKNMFLVVSGDFKSPEMKKKITELFGEFKDNKIRKSTRAKEPIQKSPRVAVEHAGFEQSVGYLAWKIPSLKHKDIPALDLLSMILGQGDSSRLVQKMRIEQPIVNSIGASVFSPENQGVFVISFGYQKDHLKGVLEGLTNTLKDFYKLPVDPREIERAVINLESDKFFSVETVDGVARSIGSQWFSAKDLHFQEKYLKLVGKVNAATLKRTAKKYLSGKTLTAAVVTNDDFKKVEKTLKSWAKDYLQWQKLVRPINSKVKVSRPLKMISKLGKSTGDVEKVVLQNGVTVLFYPSNETHLVSVKAAFLGGLRQEKDTQAGLTELLSRTWTTGTANRTENEIYDQSERIASVVQPLAGRNSIGLGMDFLAHFEKPAAELFFDVLTTPQFPEEALAREKSIQLRDIKAKKDSPSGLVGRDFMKTIFVGHPYGRDLLGDEDTIAQLHSKDVQKHWNHISQRKNLTLVIAGQFKKDIWIKAIDKYSALLGPGSHQASIFPVANIREEKHTYTFSDKEQSHVMYGYRGLKITDPERYTLQIIQSILAGQGGRLFLELRDKNSLAYSVSPVRLEGIETGYFGAYIGCSPEKVGKAISMMKEQFEILTDKSVSQEELLRAQRYLIGRHDIDLQRTAAIASSILYDDIYGIDYREPFRTAEKYLAVTSQEVKSLAERIFSEKAVISIVGPQNPWD
jgi:zinc protease